MGQLVKKREFEEQRKRESEEGESPQLRWHKIMILIKTMSRIMNNGVLMMILCQLIKIMIRNNLNKKHQLGHNFRISSRKQILYLKRIHLINLFRTQLLMKFLNQFQNQKMRLLILEKA